MKLNEEFRSLILFNSIKIDPMRPHNRRYILLFISAIICLCLIRIHLGKNQDKKEDDSAKQKRVAIQRHSISKGKISINWPPKLKEFTEMPCVELLDQFTTEYVLILIIDIGFADKVNKKMNCTSDDYPPKMAVPRNVIAHLDESILRYENDPRKNYYLIRDGEHRRAIYKYDYTTNSLWREYRNALLPRNVLLFQELWNRSQFMDCLKNVREKHPVWNMRTVLTDMTTLVKYFMKFGMYPSIAGGTLLGWYRECGFIPYTTDVDFYYRAEEYNPDAFAQIYETERPFPILYDWGKHKLNKEYSFVNDPKIDLFEVVSFPNRSSYVAVVADRVSYRNIYPLTYTSNCVADLYGYMFWTSCDPATLLSADYGTEWTIRDANMSYKKTKNLVKIKAYTKEEYQEFGLKYMRFY